MQAEGQHIQRGYLHGILVNGTKPFRYRSGIRTLLSLPSSMDARIAYPLPLPPAGFHYLRGAGLQNEVGVEAHQGFSESIAPETGLPLQRPETGSPRAGAPDRSDSRREVSAPARRSFERPSFSNTTKPRFETPSEPVPFDRKVEQELSTPASEELRIDIPGASQRQVRFPSLTPQPVEEVPGPKALQQASGTLRNEERQPVPLKDKPSTEAPIGRTTKTERSVSPLPRPMNEPVVFKRANVTPRQPRTETRNPDAQHPVKEQLAKATENRSVGPSETSRVVEMTPTLKAPPMQQVAEARLAQLRRSAGILQRKAVPQEPANQESQRPPESDRAERDRAMNVVSQPVVIVNRPQRQRETRPAFWERSYLSRLLRLRPLR